MKKQFLILVFSTSLNSFTQTMIGDFKLDGIGIFYSRENLTEGTLTSNQFVDYSSSEIFYFQDSSLNNTQQNYIYSKRSLGAELSLKKTDSRYRIIAGMQISKGFNAIYNFNDWESNYIDTVQETVVHLTPTDMTGNYTYYYYLDSLLVDSFVVDKEEIRSYSTDLFLHSEFLYDIQNDHFRFSIGMGLSAGISIKHEIVSIYSKEWSLRKVKHYWEEEDYVIWVSQQPNVSTAGIPDDYTFAPINTNFQEERGKLIYNFKPYFPIRLETHFADKGFFSKAGIMACANAGMAIQFVKGAGFSNRFFWSFKGGLFYRF